ncbi:MAG: glycosyltransferase family 4 protein [Candidatus Parcubacteria bacterium]|nr:glycosyltransferase family 4 protein [Candidatus Parcubacteria bacterium]
MNILILNWRDIKNPKRGGAEIILYELSKRLIEEGHSITWFCSSFDGALPQEVFDGIKIIRRGNKFSVYLEALWYYKKLSQKPDRVLDCVNTICWQTPLYVEREKIIFYTNQSARKVFFYEYPWFFALVGFLLEPLQYLSYKRVKAICYSDSIRNDLVSFGLSKGNISVFPLGIDHARYNPGKKFRQPTFIFVGRFVKNKRPDLVVMSLKVVVKKYPLAHLYLVGYGEEEKNLQSLIDSLGLDRNISIVNKNNSFFAKDKRDMKVTLMQAAWAILVPSVKEGWGMVVTEAASCGTPAIVSNVTGLRDSVLHNKTGIILSGNPTPQELGNAMLVIIKDVEFRNRLGKGAILWSKKFSWENSYETFKKLL